MFDIIFISYKEPNADSNFKDLQSRFPIAQRVHGVKGIHQAHIEAAKKALTKMFYVCLLYTSPSPRDATLSRMPSSA